MTNTARITRALMQIMGCDTAYQLSKKTGWAQNTVRNWLRGGSFPDEKKCLQIAAHLGAHASVILCAVAADRARARDMPAELVRGWEEGAEAAADRFNPNWRMWSASQPRASKR